MWEVRYAKSVSGRVWVYEFILTLDMELQTRVIRLLTALERKGLAIDPKRIKKIHPKLYELRIVGHEQIRIIFTVHQNNFIMLHAIRKKSRKLPLHDIQTALQRLPV